jgi:hypothetical protein
MASRSEQLSGEEGEQPFPTVHPHERFESEIGSINEQSRTLQPPSRAELTHCGFDLRD